MTKKIRLKMLPPMLPTLDMRVVKTTLQPPPKVADPFYGSIEWKRFRTEVFLERGHCCEVSSCRTSSATLYLDHIVERKDGGAPLDRGNVQILCGSCHGLKTARERARRNA